MGKAEEVCVFCGKGGLWLRVPRIKIKTKTGRDGEEGIAIPLSEVLGLVHTRLTAIPTIASPGEGDGFHHCCGFPTVSEGAANPVTWSTDRASGL